MMAARSRPRLVPVLLLAAALGACRSGAPSIEELDRGIRAAEADADRRRPLEPQIAIIELDNYRGPPVVGGNHGPAQHVRPLWRGFRPAKAMALVERLEQSYRAPASPGFDAALDHVAEVLRESGFDGSDKRFELRWLTSDAPIDGWEPRSASLVLHVAGEEPRALHSFDAPHQAERVMLPIHAPDARTRGRVVFSLDDVTEGAVLVTGAPARQVAKRAELAGAAAILSSSLGAYNVDPTGAERHLDAIQYRRMPPDTTLPVAQISPRTHRTLVEAAERGDAEVEFTAEVDTFRAPLRTLVALVHGRSKRDRAVVIAAHIDEPGAGDNATGVATMVEGAFVLREAIAAGRMHPPEATIAFVFGEEFRQSEAFLAQGTHRVIAGISADMTGQSHERTGAIALLERGPDPATTLALPPDEHSSWGQRAVEPGMGEPDGLAVIARCAMSDVARYEQRETGRPWIAADHPWEGGSDHDVFLRRGIPAVLFWHFPDFTYHTSLDRTDMVDPEEMRRTGTAILSLALAVASPSPEDLQRYVESLRLDLDIRMRAAQSANEPDLVRAWQDFGTTARSWLRKLCLGLETDDAAEFLRTPAPAAQ